MLGQIGLTMAILFVSCVAAAFVPDAVSATVHDPECFATYSLIGFPVPALVLECSDENCFQCDPCALTVTESSPLSITQMCVCGGSGNTSSPTFCKTFVVTSPTGTWWSYYCFGSCESPPEELITCSKVEGSAGELEGQKLCDC